MNCLEEVRGRDFVGKKEIRPLREDGGGAIDNHPLCSASPQAPEPKGPLQLQDSLQ